MARLGPFTADRRVVAGVSGGADSMALAWLLARWGRPLVCIVDHGLRRGSDLEAAQAGQRLAAIGIPSRIVQARLAQGPGLAARARQARYALLNQACIAAGCTDLAVAHHASDQAETVMLRRASGSGPAGLAAMAAITHHDSVRLLRPLLGIGPARLRATLHAAGLAWAEDPSNADPVTPRARLRRSMTPAGIAAACEHAARHGAERQAAEAAAAAELGRVELYPEGYAFCAGPLGPAAFSSLVWCLSGRDHPPATASLAAGLRPRTLHGVAIAAAGRCGPGVLLSREPAAMAPPVPAESGAYWDNRFRLGSTWPGATIGATIGALGSDAPRFRRRSGLPSAILRTLPALRRGADLLAVPHLHFPDAETCRSLRLRFAPPHVAAGAPFVRR